MDLIRLRAAPVGGDLLSCAKEPGGEVESICGCMYVDTLP